MCRYVGESISLELFYFVSLTSSCSLIPNETGFKRCVILYSWLLETNIFIVFCYNNNGNNILFYHRSYQYILEYSPPQGRQRPQRKLLRMWLRWCVNPWALWRPSSKRWSCPSCPKLAPARWPATPWPPWLLASHFRCVWGSDLYAVGVLGNIILRLNWWILFRWVDFSV